MYHDHGDSESRIQAATQQAEPRKKHSHGSILDPRLSIAGRKPRSGAVIHVIFWVSR